MRVVQRSDDNPEPERVLLLSATNMGPVQVTLYNALVAYPTRWQFENFKSFGVLNPLHNYPTSAELSIGPFGGDLPKKLDIGEQFSSYFIVDHEMLARVSKDRLFGHTFGSLHWAPRRHILDALPGIREACERVGKSWR